MSKLVLPTLAAILVSIFSGSFAIWLILGLSNVNLSSSAMAMMPLIALMGALLSFPLAILFGGIPATIAVIALGVPLHRQLIRRGLTGVRHYLLAGLAVGAVAALGLGLYMSRSIPVVGTELLVAKAIVAAACVFGGAVSATVFRLLLDPAMLAKVDASQN